MSISLDRFAYGLPDPQEKELKLLGHCPQCGKGIYAGYEYVKFFDDVFCDLHCFFQYMGAEEVY